METTQFPGLSDQARTLPAESVGRSRQMHRLVDLYASSEAASALHGAVSRIRENGGVVARALASADTVVGDALTDRSLATDDSVRDALRDAVASPEFLALVPEWIRELREIAASRPDCGACTVASALDLWSWSMNYLMNEESTSQAVDDLAEAICPLLAARSFALEVTSTTSTEAQLRLDLSNVYAARASAQAAATCAELVFGFRRHLVWDAEGCTTCFAGEELDDLEALIPGIASGTRGSGDVVEADGSHASKRGPCASFNGVDTFIRLRTRLDGCLTGSGVAKERAAASIAISMTGSKGRA